MNLKDKLCEMISQSRSDFSVENFNHYLRIMEKKSKKKNELQKKINSLARTAMTYNNIEALRVLLIDFNVKAQINDNNYYLLRFPLFYGLENTISFFLENGFYDKWYGLNDFIKTYDFSNKEYFLLQYNARQEKNKLDQSLEKVHEGVKSSISLKI